MSWFRRPPPVSRHGGALPQGRHLDHPQRRRSTRRGVARGGGVLSRETPASTFSSHPSLTNTQREFLGSSYGFRPGRNAHQAIDAICQHLSAGFVEVYDADLKSYFDTIPHDRLIKCLERRIADRTVLRLIRMWLEAPVVETDEQGRGTRTRPKQGTPQGGVISPLLANVSLHWFEKLFVRTDGTG